MMKNKNAETLCVDADKNKISRTLETVCFNMIQLQNIVSICTLISGFACCIYNIYTEIKKNNHN